MKTTNLKKLFAATLMIAVFTAPSYSQNHTKGKSVRDTVPEYKFSVSTTWLTFDNFGPEETNTHHYELHFGYKLTSKDKIGIKVATWKMFAPMGMPMQEQLKFDENNF